MKNIKLSDLKIYLVLGLILFLAFDFCAGKNQEKECQVNNRAFVPGHTEIETHKDKDSKTQVSTRYVSDRYYLFINAQGDYHKVEVSMQAYSYSLEHPKMKFTYRKGYLTGFYYLKDCHPLITEY